MLRTRLFVQFAERHILYSYCATNVHCATLQSYGLKLFFLRTVALVLLKSKSANPPAPEEVKLEDSPPFETVDNVAFIARKFNIIEFQGDTIEVSLRESKGNRRRKREVTVLDILSSGATYRATQLNTDESGVCKTLLKVVLRI